MGHSNIGGHEIVQHLFILFSLKNMLELYFYNYLCKDAIIKSIREC